MGICCVGSRGEPSDRKTCAEIGGTYYEDESRSCLGHAVCSFLTVLAVYLKRNSNGDPVVLLASGGTYSSLYDLRDNILSKSPLGKRILALYKKLSPKTVDILGSDPALLRDTLRVFLIGAAFSRAILAEFEGRRLSKQPRLTQDVFKDGLEVLKRFRSQAKSDTELLEAAEFIENEAKRFVGVSPRRALDLLGVKPKLKRPTRVRNRSA